MTDDTDDVDVECPRCDEPAERVEFLLADPMALDDPDVRTFECTNDDCIRARIPVDIEQERALSYAG